MRKPALIAVAGVLLVCAAAAHVFQDRPEGSSAETTAALDKLRAAGDERARYSSSPDSEMAATIRFFDSRSPLSVRAYRKGVAFYLSDVTLSAAFGLSVKWDPLYRLLTMAGRKGEAVAVVGGTAARVGERTVNLPHPFMEMPGRLLVPVDFLEAELPSISGFSASWSESSSVFSASPQEPSVVDVTMGGRPGLARVTISTLRPLAYRVVEKGGELKVVVRGAVPGSDFGVQGAAMSPIGRHAVSWRGDELVLALDLADQAGSFQTFREEYPQGIVLLVSSALYREGFDLEPLAGSYRRWGRVRTVVLDPAHGGDDLGASGPDGLLEKDVVLQICKKAAAIIRDRLDLKIYLTRDSDYRMPPAGRAETANSRGADLFVSVHCDSWPPGGRSGYGAYVLPPPASEGGYWSPESKRRAGMAGEDLEWGPVLRPWRRIQGRYGMESRALASALLKEIEVVHTGPGRGVSEMPLVSLAGVDAPAVSVQCGFLNGGGDLELLSDRQGRDRLAAALARGIEEYIDARR